MTPKIYVMLISLGLCTLILDGCFLYRSPKPEIIYIKKNEDGRVTEKREKGSNCCEGSYTRTYLYDAKGRDTLVYGVVGYHREKQIYRYDGDTKIYQVYAEIDADTSVENFDIYDPKVTYRSIIQYHLDGWIEKSQEFRLFKQFDEYDTAYINSKTFNIFNQVKDGFEFKKEIEDFGQDSIKLHCIYENYKTRTLDTLRIETKLSMGAY